MDLFLPLLKSSMKIECIKEVKIIYSTSLCGIPIDNIKYLKIIIRAVVLLKSLFI